MLTRRGETVLLCALGAIVIALAGLVGMTAALPVTYALAAAFLALVISASLLCVIAVTVALYLARRDERSEQ